MLMIFLLCPSLMIDTIKKKASIGQEGHKGKTTIITWMICEV